jgi:uncharacterized protein
MRKLLTILFAGLLSVCSVDAQKVIPQTNPPRLVVDNAHILSPSQAEELEAKLVAFDNNTSNQIAIAIVSSLNDQPIEDVAVNTLREWKIGDKKKNNGILIVVAVEDRKIKIETGYGLEGAIPDVTCSDIIEKDIKPAFRQKDYFGGLSKATDDLGKAAAGEYSVQRAPRSGGKGAGNIFKFIIIVIIVIVILASRGGGGGGGIMMLPFLLGGGGGGNWDSGSSGGGGGDFGGFGGGSSGGGGASGSW